MENPCIKCKMTFSEKSVCCGCPERLEWEKNKKASLKVSHDESGEVQAVLKDVELTI